jgi:hypothetical protein
LWQVGMRKKIHKNNSGANRFASLVLIWITNWPKALFEPRAGNIFKHINHVAAVISSRALHCCHSICKLQLFRLQFVMILSFSHEFFQSSAIRNSHLCAHGKGCLVLDWLGHVEILSPTHQHLHFQHLFHRVLHSLSTQSGVFHSAVGHLVAAVCRHIIHDHSAHFQLFKRPRDVFF